MPTPPVPPLSSLLVPLGLLVACSGGPPPPGTLPVQGPPPNAVGGFAVELPAVVLQPGEERLPCYIFDLAVTGPSRVVAAGQVTTGAGLHHGNITTRPRTGAGMRTCPEGTDFVGVDIASGGAVLFGSSTQFVGTEWQNLPTGLGYRLKDGYEIVARMHYLNVSTSAVTVQPRYQWYTIAEADLKQEVAPFAWQYTGFMIPPHGTLSVQSICHINATMHIVSAMPHMHASGTIFTAGMVAAGRPGPKFLDDSNYAARGDSDIREYSPPQVIQPGADAGFYWGCTWHNPYDVTLIDGVGLNEMCILFGYAYPPASAFSALGVSETACQPVTTSQVP